MNRNLLLVLSGLAALLIIAGIVVTIVANGPWEIILTSGTVGLLVLGSLVTSALRRKRKD